MNNWTAYIIELIENMTRADLPEQNDILREINEAYNFEYVDRSVRQQLIEYLQSQSEWLQKEIAIQHYQMIYDIQLRQEKRKRQTEIERLLIVADEEWKAKNVRVGRPRTTIISLLLTDK